MAEPTSMSIKAAPAIRSLSTSSAASDPIGAANPGQPKLFVTVRLVATVDAWLAVGAAPTAAIATAGSFLLPGGVVEYLDIPAGSAIAGIIAAGTGSLSITQMEKL